MKRPRYILLVILLLMTGAIVNVAVAWTLAMAVDLGAEVRTYRETSRSGRFLVQWDGWTHPNAYLLSTMCLCMQRDGEGYGARDPTPDWAPHDREPSEWMLTHAPEAVFELQVIEARGWPTLALTCWYRGRHVPGTSMTEEQLQGIHIGDWPRTSGYRRRVLPTHPIWPGFAINTVFYALVLWLLFAAPLALRRRRRIKRGLCPKCAYDLRGSDSQKCPECWQARCGQER